MTFLCDDFFPASLVSQCKLCYASIIQIHIQCVGRAVWGCIFSFLPRCISLTEVDNIHVPTWLTIYMPCMSLDIAVSMAFVGRNILSCRAISTRYISDQLSNKHCMILCLALLQNTLLKNADGLCYVSYKCTLTVRCIHDLF